MSQPVAGTNALSNVATVTPRVDGTPDIWTELHELIQRTLANLESEIRHRVDGVRVARGRTKGNHFYLFSYLTFSIPNAELDPVVCGIAFKPADQGVTIEADISGEQTGDCISAVPSKTVANAREELLKAADELAHQLCKSTDAIETALNNASRRVG